MHGSLLPRTTSRPWVAGGDASGPGVGASPPQEAYHRSATASRSSPGTSGVASHERLNRRGINTRPRSNGACASQSRAAARPRVAASPSARRRMPGVPNAVTFPSPHRFGAGP